MEARVELDSVVIDRPIEEVFSFMTNMENSPIWGRSHSTTQISEGTVAVGTRFREISAGSEEEIEKETVITGLEPPISYSYTSRYQNGIEESARISLEDLAGGLGCSRQLRFTFQTCLRTKRVRWWLR